nr:IPTL-CTERM sorting domain-containing protein [uncultured Acidovorax sp.]
MAPPAVASIPTLSEWGMILLSLALAVFGVWSLRCRGYAPGATQRE